MCHINLLLLFICLSINAQFVSIMGCDNEIRINLSLDQIGEFVQSVRQPFFKQIATNESPSSGGDENEHWLITLDKKLIHIGIKHGVLRLIRQIYNRIYKVTHIIRNKYNELFCENLGEKQCREKEKETIARLTVRELFNMAKIIVRFKILKRINDSNVSENVKLYIWWYRFRYHVDSAVKFEQIGSETEIRLGIVQYYNQICKEFNELIKQIDQDHSNLNEVLMILAKIPYIRIKTNWKSEKLTNFNPVAELPQDKSKALMSKPTGAGMPVYVYSERFPSRLKIGAACQAMDIEHRFVKVYDIEFHFGMNEGVIISDKIRKRTDPERGVKINFIGWTKESQWEVQKIYDQFNDFYLEDGVFKEGKFSITKYHLSANNCIHFSNAFVEALLKNNDQIKKVGKAFEKPPSVLKQPLINGNSCQFVANCFMPPTTSDSDD